jgi:penicillin amidase
VLLQTNADESQYLTPKGWLDFGVEFEEVLIKDMDAKSVAVKTTIWGPVIGRAPTGEPMAMRWVLHDVEGSNMNLGLMETADTVQDALQIAAIAGTPGQNLNVVDHLGQQAWTIMGRLPNRVGFDGKLPVSWADGLVGWDGYLTAEDYPVWLNPESGRIWTANARIAADDALRKVGTGTYALGARQQQIRDVMLNQEQFTEQDFLDLQLDDRAVFLSRWQTVLLETLANSQHHLASEAFNLVESWGARADKDSQGYLLVKRFREAVVNNSVAEVLRWVDSNRQGDYFSIGHVDNFIEYPTWALVSQQPEQHLPVGYSTWADFLDAMAIQVMSNLVNNYGSLEQATWGNANKLKIVHPLASAIPVLGDSLNMPATPSSGDTYMPFVQSPTHGASQRFAVAPGHEESGFFHMATGQSSHPLSSYYRLGHDDWLNGEFSAFLPGETKWTLSLNAE